MAYSNREVASLAGQVFAHTAEYQVPATFANRDISRAKLGEFLNPDRRSRNLLMVSDLLGSGKTFLVDLVIGELALAESKPLICGKNSPKIMADRARFGAIFVDEWDIKASPKTLVKSLDLLEDYMAEATVPVVLIGDNTLKSPQMRRRLANMADVHDIPMEGLGPDFFRLALQSRLRHAAKRDDDVAILAPELEAAIVPDWPQTAATFREVLRTLQQMAGHLSVDDQPCRIGEAEAGKWLALQRLEGLGDRRRTFYQRLLSALTERRDSLGPMTVADLAELSPDEKQQTDFVTEIIEPLARGGLLGSLGLPSFSPDGTSYDRYPGPYLPSVQTMVRLTYGGQHG